MVIPSLPARDRVGILQPMNRDDLCEQFLDAVPFDLYPFQEEALLAWFETDTGILVTAPTGMGKTLIAQSAVFEALQTGETLYYTTPLIALTDQKFRELQDQAVAWGFHEEDVGLVTGNRKVNPDAVVKVVVAEILLNHLLSNPEEFDRVGAVVMDEFHYFNDFERGIVWELSLVFLPKSVRLMLLSATVGNPIEFLNWLADEHGRRLRLCQTDQRRVPLEFHWVDDKLLSEHLPAMALGDDSERRTPALVFSFVRDGCWEVAERLKGLPLIDKEARAEIEEYLADRDMTTGIGPKLQQMLIRGVGVHHAGVLPKHKEVVEELFLRKLVPFVVCTETLAAGINLPARSAVLATLITGPFGQKKVIPASSAHQMFGRAGRPQFDTQGYVFALAHDDDVKIKKWKAKYDQIDAKTKDPALLRARKQLERKRPTRRTTEQYWTEGQFESLIKAGPAKLQSRSMIPYRVLIYLLDRSTDLADVRSFLKRRFNNAEKLQAFEKQLECMVANLESLGYITREAGQDHVVVQGDLQDLLRFRSIDPLFGAYLAKTLVNGDFSEKLEALESVLDMPPKIIRAAGYPEQQAGPLQKEYLEPMMTAMGVRLQAPEPEESEGYTEDFNPWKAEEERPPTFPEMLKLAFESDLAFPEDLSIRQKWVAGGVLDSGDDFYRFISSRSLQKNEGIVFRHLLRLVILGNEFRSRTDDPDYTAIVERVTDACDRVDPAYTKRFLASAEEDRHLLDR